MERSGTGSFKSIMEDPAGPGLRSLGKLRYCRTAHARARFFHENFEAEERDALAPAPTMHVPLDAQVAQLGMHRHVQQDRIDAAVLTLAKREQRIDAPFALIRRTPD